MLKDIIVVFRSDMKCRFKTHIIVASLSECNILCISFISLVVYHIIAIPANNIKNMALICCSIL